MDVDPVSLLAASKIRIGRLRAQGVPAILLGVAGIVVAAGAVRALRAALPNLPETLREAKNLVDARRELRQLKG